ncbi:MAG TPA: hypothetical protein VGQ00_01295 [Candidatus Norongarragalinales archaeon]|nr:hypothetical protein [Candidatus Norongarragalinales archaeon]
MNTKELAALAVIAAIVAVGAYFLLVPKSTTHDVTGLKVITEPPAEPLAAIAAVLASDTVKLEEHLRAVNSTENTAVIISSSEIMAGLSSCRKILFYGVLDDGTSINCQEANGCSNSIITVQKGPCDCIKVTRNHVTIEGSEQWLRYNALAFKKLFSFTVKDTCVPQTLPAPVITATPTPSPTPTATPTPSVPANASNTTG